MSRQTSLADAFAGRLKRARSPLSAAVASSHETIEPAYVAIIGSAGRRHDGSRMNAALFEAMKVFVRRTMSETFQLSSRRVVLVSGGSAWCDAVAVSVFLDDVDTASKTPISGLELYLPCDRAPISISTTTKPRYVQSGTGDWRTDPGQTLNYLFEQFSRKMGRDMQVDIEQAVDKGAKVWCPSVQDQLSGFVGNKRFKNTAKNVSQLSSFHRRNLLIAQRATHMIAFTWSPHVTTLQDGGTSFTFEHCTGRKLHQPLHTLCVPSVSLSALGEVSVTTFGAKPCALFSSSTEQVSQTSAIDATSHANPTASVTQVSTVVSINSAEERN